jgi:hypothetical protein
MSKLRVNTVSAFSGNMVTVTGELSSSFFGDGGGLYNLPAQTLPSGIVSSSAQLNNSTLSGMAVSGSLSGSFQGNGFGLTDLNIFPYSGSAQITGSLEVTGSLAVVEGNVKVGDDSSNGILELNSALPASSFARTTGEFYIKGNIRYDMGPTINYYPSIWRQQLTNIGPFSGVSTLSFAMSANGGAYTECLKIIGETQANPQLITIETPGLFAGNALRFPSSQVAYAEPNTLDDYEVGTFTPTCVGTTTEGTVTYGTRNGNYTKVGNAVHFQLRIGWSGHTGTGNLRITDLPFTSANITDVIWTCAVSFNGLTFPPTAQNKQLTAEIPANQAYINLIAGDTNGAPAAGVPVDTSVTYIIITGTYFT